VGDRTTVRLEIGGSVTQAEWLELLKLLESGGAQNDEDGYTIRSNKPPTFIEGQSFTVFFDECNYGEAPDEILEWLDEHRLPYKHSWEAGGGYGPGAHIVLPGQPWISYGTLDYEPAMPIYEIEKHLKDGTLEQQLALFKTDIPPFKVTE